MELMRRKVLRCIMVCTMIITLIPIKDVVALGSEMPFKDVPSSAWYYSDVKEAWEMGLINGMNETTFAPDKNMTYAQTVKLAACINQKYLFDSVTLEEGSPYWYSSYVEYARENGVIVTEYNWDDNIMRADFAEIFVNALPEEALGEKNTVEDGAIPDVSSSHPQAAVIYKLYRAGIVNGMDKNGTFQPDSPIRRSEVSAILTRMMNETARKDLILIFNRQPQELGIETANIRIGVKIPVLMYHEVSDNIWGLNYLFVSPDSMRQQLQWLKDNGYETLFFSDLTHLYDYRKPVMLTFDDGYEGNYMNLFPLLKEYNMKATIFVVSDEIGTEHRLTKEQLREMSDSGLVSIQSHTKSHTRMDTLNEQALIEECQESKTVIGGITGISPYVLAYPEGKRSTLSDSVASCYYSFGVLDRNGSWRTSRKTLYRITRTVIPREFTLKQFAANVRR